MKAIGYKAGVKILELDKSSITQADADAYAGSIDSLVVEGGPTYTPAPPEAPQVEPLQQVKTIQKTREELAREALLDCKGKAFLALVAGGMSHEDANAAGTALVVQHYGFMGAYELAGGNPASKAALMAAIEANPPAWWSPTIAAIFDEAL